MNVFKIAWRSLQHRGLGSGLTILSMALGVMMVVAVLSIHGLVSKSFKSNNSFGYNVLVGARGGGLQLTLNTVFYLSRPVENIPYEYYLAFCDPETRNRELKNSIAFHAKQNIVDTTELTSSLGLGGFGSAFSSALLADAFDQQQIAAMKIEKAGIYRRYTHVAIPICLGDSYVDPETGADFKCVGTKPHFFTDLVLDIDAETKFEFAQGRAFVENSPEHGFFECVVGAMTAKRCKIKLGDKLQATHDFNSDSAHIHEQEYTVVGILAPTLTPHDRVVFLNMEGFFLMEDHAMNIKSDAVLKTGDQDEPAKPTTVDPFFDTDSDYEIKPLDDSWDTPSGDSDDAADADTPTLTVSEEFARKKNATRISLPIEQREVTSILVRTSLNDQGNVIGIFLPGQINDGGDLETTLDWSPFRPERSQKAAQAVNPVMQVAALFQLFVDPIRWLLLGLTLMICIVSGLSILVGIYNSMSQRQHEIAVMRALGANRSKVMMIMLTEAVLLALVGGMLGWAAGHALNASLSPMVESRTGVSIGFFDFAPAVPLARFPLAGYFPEIITRMSISPELLLIPGLIILAVMVGVYPAISAYRTDVSKSLGK